VFKPDPAGHDKAQHRFVESHTLETENMAKFSLNYKFELGFRLKNTVRTITDVVVAKIFPSLLIWLFKLISATIVLVKTIAPSTVRLYFMFCPVGKFIAVI
jgi:hypothetical protein